MPTPSVQLSLLPYSEQIAVAFHSVEQLADDVASKLASAFVFRGSDEWPRELVRKQGNEHLYIDDNDSKHSEN